MNKNNDMTNAVNDSDAGAFDVEGNPLDTGRLWPINQAALISGVTTRTLRYYDETDLVKPAETSAGGKRWYDWVSLVRLQFVILLRDAGLSIADIAAIAQPGEHNVRQAIDAKTKELRHDIETIERKLQVLHNLSDLCDADGDIEQMNQMAGNPALAGLPVDSAVRWSALSPEELEQARQTWENMLRQSHETWSPTPSNGSDCSRRARPRIRPRCSRLPNGSWTGTSRPPAPRRRGIKTRP